MKVLNKLILAALIVSMGFAFNACEDDTTSPTEPDVPAPTNLAATSIVDTETESYGISFKFEAPIDLDESSFDQYKINVYPEGSSASSGIEFFAEEPTGGTFNANDLELETVYVIEVRTVYSNGDESSAISMKWAPATRFEQVAASTIRIYELSSNFGSGLDLFEDVFEEPEVLTVSNYENWNVGAYIEGENSITFGSANSLEFNNAGQATTPAEVSKFEPANGFNDVFDSEALDSDSFDYQERASEITTTPLNGKSGLIVYLRIASSETGKFNYAKVFIKADSNGNYLKGSSPNRHIEVEISYQTGVNLPYAKR